MIEFIEKMFHIKTIRHEYTRLNNLPIGIRGLYEITVAATAEIEFLVLKPNKKINRYCLMNSELNRTKKKFVILYYFTNFFNTSLWNKEF